MSSKPTDKLHIINKTSNTPTPTLDPSHLILNIQLNNLGTYAILDTGGRYCYMSKQFAEENNIEVESDPNISPIQNLNDNNLNPNLLQTKPLNITVGPKTVLLSFKIIESPTPTILGLNWLITVNPTIN